MRVWAVNGTNFVDPQSPAGGSTVQWKFNNVTTSLFTAYNSATSLTATVQRGQVFHPGPGVNSLSGWDSVLWRPNAPRCCADPVKGKSRVAAPTIERRIRFLMAL